ncbi:LytR family transcriptional attenuator [Streptomyces sp. 846.5]|nr:LCP family protein [Streptomyces sp. 846.5]TDU06297.1 LytR family transcriptional attenuator [Streptomyces sp. 846.5]
MTTHDGWDDGSSARRNSGGFRQDAGDISGWETRTSRPGQAGQAGAPWAQSQGQQPLPPELNPRGPGAGRRSGGQQVGRPVPQQQPSYGEQPSYGRQGSPAGPPGSGLPPELDPRGPGRGGKGGGTGPGSGRRKWSRSRKVRFTLFAVVLTLLVVSVGTYFWADSKLTHSNVLVDYAGRPATGKGTNWLVVGSDSRQGLTKAEQQALHTGYDTGARTDSMMILHQGSNGNTLMSIPRDSYVTIPAWTDSKGVKHSAAKHKINAAYAEGGGALLVQTLEYNTGLHIDHYAEIGFSGFVNVVNDLGGIDICLTKAIVDKASGANLKAGCQTLNGAQALAFVRERHQEATQDLARMQHQQQFLAALSHKATSAGTLLNPFTLYPTLNSGLSLLTVDNNTGLTDLSSMFFAMKDVKSGNGKTITVPIANANYPTASDGDAVKWNMTEAQQVFNAFKNDTTVPTFTS